MTKLEAELLITELTPFVDTAYSEFRSVESTIEHFIIRGTELNDIDGECLPTVVLKGSKGYTERNIETVLFHLRTKKA